MESIFLKRETSIYIEFYHILCSVILLNGKLSHWSHKTQSILHISFMRYCKEGNKISEWLVLHMEIFKISSFCLSHHHFLPLRFPPHCKGREVTSQYLIQIQENNSLFIFKIFCWKHVPFGSPTPFLTSTAS